MTPLGQVQLREELQRLKEVEMPQVVKDIATARDHGDLSENAEYHAAKERQGMLHARAKYIEDVLSRAEVIDPAKLGGDKVNLGAPYVSGASVTAEIVDREAKGPKIDIVEEVTYQLVGPEESDLKQGRISISSPLARGLIGHQVGDEVTIKLPNGTRVYEIQEIEFK